MHTLVRARLAPICMLSRGLVTTFLRRKLIKSTLLVGQACLCAILLLPLQGTMFEFTVLLRYILYLSPTVLQHSQLVPLPPLPHFLFLGPFVQQEGRKEGKREEKEGSFSCPCFARSPLPPFFCPDLSPSSRGKKVQYNSHIKVKLQ